MEAVVAQVRPVLKAADFRKRAHTFNRTLEPGMVQVVTFQMGRYGPPGVVQVPGLRESLYGLFSVHLGVFIEEAWRLDVGRFGAGGPPGDKHWVNDYDCQLRRTVDNPAGQSMHHLWPLEAPDVGPTVVGLLASDALPWFSGFGSRQAVLARLESSPIGSHELTGEGPDRLVAALMRMGAGDRRRAQEHFDEWVTFCRQEAIAEPHLRGHLEYLAGFAARVGLTMPGAAVPG